LGENSHNNEIFKRKFGPRDLMYYGEFCWWYVWVIVSFFSNFLNFQCVWAMVHFTFMGTNGMWIKNFNLCVVLECVGMFVLFKLLNYSMYGDMFSFYFIEK
jgi:hypothetical protein